jgi:serine/threonine protein kinase
MIKFSRLKFVTYISSGDFDEFHDEYYLLKQLQQYDSFVKLVDHSFKRSSPLIASYTMSDVGRQFDNHKNLLRNDMKAIVTSLHYLHQNNIIHGDPRLQNIILVGTNQKKLKWIDVREIGTFETDVKILWKSLKNKEWDDNHIIHAQNLRTYVSNVNAPDAFSTLWSMFETIQLINVV